MSMSKTFYVDVIRGHPLSPEMTFVIDDLRFCNIPVSSVEMGLNYLRLLHNGLTREADSMIRKRTLLWQPYFGNVLNYVDYCLESLEQWNVSFELRLDRALEAIFVEQLSDRDSPFCRSVMREIEMARGRTIEFQVYGSDPVLTLGHDVGENTSQDIGSNVYGRCLQKLVSKFQNGEHLVRELRSFIDPNSRDTEAKRSVLFLADSQLGLLRCTYLGAEVIPISGGNYGHISYALSYGKIPVRDFALIVIYAGTNCFNFDYSVSSDRRNRDFDLLLDALKEIRLFNSKILFCCALNHPHVLPHNIDHMCFVEEQLAKIGVTCLNWNDVGDPFLDAKGRPIPSYFRDDIHLSPRGTRLLIDYLRDAMPKLRLIPLEVADETYTIRKSEFEGVTVSSRVVRVEPSERRSRSPLLRNSAQILPSTSRNNRAVYDTVFCSDKNYADRHSVSRSRGPFSRSPTRRSQREPLSRSPIRQSKREHPSCSPNRRSKREPLSRSPIRRSKRESLSRSPVRHSNRPTDSNGDRHASHHHSERKPKSRHSRKMGHAKSARRSLTDRESHSPSHRSRSSSSEKSNRERGKQSDTEESATDQESKRDKFRLERKSGEKL